MGSHDSSEAGHGITRRQAVGRGAAGALALSAGSVLAACGSDDEPSGSDSTSPATNEAAAAQTGGTLRVGFQSAGTTGSIDPDFTAGQSVEYGRHNGLHNLLVGRDDEVQLQMMLAEEVTSNDAGDEWTVRLKDGVEFHNGKTLAAEDVIASFRRKLGKDSSAKSTFSFLDPKGIKQVDERTVRFTLKQPYGPFREALATIAGYITPVDFDPKNPVGTGPFMFKSFKPGDLTELERFPNYFLEPALVDELHLIEFQDESAQTNALLAGQIEASGGLPFAQVKVLEQRDDLATVISQSCAWRPFVMRCDVAPFDDVRVRQAMRLIVNRQELIDSAFAGQGEIANDLYAPFDPCYNSEIAQREQDLEQAKSLLKAAGHDSLSLKLTTSAIAPGLIEASAVIVQQAKAANVNITLDKVNPSDYFGDRWLSYEFTVDYWSQPDYLATASLADGPGAVYNETHFDDDEFNSLYAKAIVETDQETRFGIAREMQAIQHERGGYIIWGFPNYIDAHSKKVTGFKSLKAVLPLNNTRFEAVGFTA
jgi:peptide/nickel transport system substrate-binding protein